MTHLTLSRGKNPKSVTLSGKGVTLRGSFSHNWPMWEKVLHMLATGQIDLGPILNRIAPLEDWKSCFDEMHAGEVVKAVSGKFAPCEVKIQKIGKPAR